jgi:4-hydroxybenzoate polyprenyltransferase
VKTLSWILLSGRPKHWVKNLVVFAALVFSQNLSNPGMLIQVAETFALFCLASAAVYLINDIADREQDRFHPEKRDRPIASGKLAIGPAGAAAMILIAAALTGGYALGPIMFLILLGYVALNLAYSFYLKNIILLDAFSIALGFVFRVVAGAEVIQVEISAWIVLCTVLGSLFLAFSKRRHELGLEDAAANHRPALADYSVYFLDQMIAVVTASTVMAYALWTMWPSVAEKFHTHRLPWTVPFVCYGIFRYLYLVHQKGEGGSPTKIFISDPPMLINIALWMGSVIAILYLLPLSP